MPEIDQLQIESSVDRILNRWPAVGLAVGVIRDGALELFSGHGVANIESATPVTEDTVFRIGSITKTFTAIAVMQLWERGLIDLDASAPTTTCAPSSWSRRRQAGVRPPCGICSPTRPACREWLHPSRMVNSDWFGETFCAGRRVPTLAEYYRGGLRLAVEPGTIWAYTDHGFATLGQIVEDVSGEPLDRYLREHIFEPLGMADTRPRALEPGTIAALDRVHAAPEGREGRTDHQGVTAAARLDLLHAEGHGALHRRASWRWRG